MYTNSESQKRTKTTNPQIIEQLDLVLPTIRFIINVKLQANQQIISDAYEEVVTQTKTTFSIDEAVNCVNNNNWIRLLSKLGMIRSFYSQPRTLNIDDLNKTPEAIVDMIIGRIEYQLNTYTSPFSHYKTDQEVGWTLLDTFFSTNLISWANHRRETTLQSKISDLINQLTNQDPLFRDIDDCIVISTIDDKNQYATLFHKDLGGTSRTNSSYMQSQTRNFGHDPSSVKINRKIDRYVLNQYDVVYRENNKTYLAQYNTESEHYTINQISDNSQHVDNSIKLNNINTLYPQTAMLINQLLSNIQSHKQLAKQALTLQHEAVINESQNQTVTQGDNSNDSLVMDVDTDNIHMNNPLSPVPMIVEVNNNQNDTEPASGQPEANSPNCVNQPSDPMSICPETAVGGADSQRFSDQYSPMSDDTTEMLSRQKPAVSESGMIYDEAELSPEMVNQATEIYRNISERYTSFESFCTTDNLELKQQQECLFNFFRENCLNDDQSLAQRYLILTNAILFFSANYSKQTRAMQIDSGDIDLQEKIDLVPHNPNKTIQVSFKNQGATCWINAAMQIVIRSDLFDDYLRSIEPSSLRSSKHQLFYKTLVQLINSSRSQDGPCIIDHEMRDFVNAFESLEDELTQSDIETFKVRHIGDQPSTLFQKMFIILGNPTNQHTIKVGTVYADSSGQYHISDNQSEDTQLILSPYPTKSHLQSSRLLSSQSQLDPSSPIEEFNKVMAYRQNILRSAPETIQVDIKQNLIERSQLQQGDLTFLAIIGNQYYELCYKRLSEAFKTNHWHYKSAHYHDDSVEIISDTLVTSQQELGPVISSYLYLKYHSAKLLTEAEFFDQLSSLRIEPLAENDAQRIETPTTVEEPPLENKGQVNTRKSAKPTDLLKEFYSTPPFLETKMMDSTTINIDTVIDRIPSTKREIIKQYLSSVSDDIWDYQACSVIQIASAALSDTPLPYFLMNGCGTGKTIIIIHAAAVLQAIGKQAIIVVPNKEILNMFSHEMKKRTLSINLLTTHQWREKENETKKSYHCVLYDEAHLIKKNNRNFLSNQFNVFSSATLSVDDFIDFTKPYKLLLNNNLQRLQLGNNFIKSSILLKLMSDNAIASTTNLPYNPQTNHKTTYLVDIPNKSKELIDDIESYEKFRGFLCQYDEKLHQLYSSKNTQRIIIHDLIARAENSISFRNSLRMFSKEHKENNLFHMYITLSEYRDTARFQSLKKIAIQSMKTLTNKQSDTPILDSNNQVVLTHCDYTMQELNDLRQVCQLVDQAEASFKLTSFKEQRPTLEELQQNGLSVKLANNQFDINPDQTIGKDLRLVFITGSHTSGFNYDGPIKHHAHQPQFRLHVVCLGDTKRVTQESQLWYRPVRATSCHLITSSNLSFETVRAVISHRELKRDEEINAQSRIRGQQLRDSNLSAVRIGFNRSKDKEQESLEDIMKTNAICKTLSQQSKAIKTFIDLSHQNLNLAQFVDSKRILYSDADNVIYHSQVSGQRIVFSNKRTLTNIFVILDELFGSDNKIDMNHADMTGYLVSHDTFEKLHKTSNYTWHRIINDPYWASNRLPMGPNKAKLVKIRNMNKKAKQSPKKTLSSAISTRNILSKTTVEYSWYTHPDTYKRHIIDLLNDLNKENITDKVMNLINTHGYDIIVTTIPAELYDIGDLLPDCHYFRIYDLMLAMGEPRLIMACEEKRNSRCDSLLLTRLPPANRKMSGWSLIHTATYFGSKDCVEYLLKLDPMFATLKTTNATTPENIQKKNGTSAQSTEVDKLLAETKSETTLIDLVEIDQNRTAAIIEACHQNLDLSKYTFDELFSTLKNKNCDNAAKTKLNDVLNQKANRDCDDFINACQCNEYIRNTSQSGESVDSEGQQDLLTIDYDGLILDPFIRSLNSTSLDNTIKKIKKIIENQDTIFGYTGLKFKDRLMVLAQRDSQVRLSLKILFFEQKPDGQNNQSIRDLIKEVYQAIDDFKTTPIELANLKPASTYYSSGKDLSTQLTQLYPTVFSEQMTLAKWAKHPSYEQVNDIKLLYHFLRDVTKFSMSDDIKLSPIDLMKRRNYELNSPLFQIISQILDSPLQHSGNHRFIKASKLLPVGSKAFARKIKNALEYITNPYKGVPNLLKYMTCMWLIEFTYASVKNWHHVHFDHKLPFQLFHSKKHFLSLRQYEEDWKEIVLPKLDTKISVNESLKTSIINYVDCQTSKSSGFKSLVQNMTTCELSSNRAHMLEEFKRTKCLTNNQMGRDSIMSGEDIKWVVKNPALLSEIEYVQLVGLEHWTAEDYNELMSALPRAVNVDTTKYLGKRLFSQRDLFIRTINSAGQTDPSLIKSYLFPTKMPETIEKIILNNCCALPKLLPIDYTLNNYFVVIGLSERTTNVQKIDEYNCIVFADSFNDVIHIVSALSNNCSKPFNLKIVNYGPQEFQLTHRKYSRLFEFSLDIVHYSGDETDKLEIDELNSLNQTALLSVDQISTRIADKECMKSRNNVSLDVSIHGTCMNRIFRPFLQHSATKFTPLSDHDKTILFHTLLPIITSDEDNSISVTYRVQELIIQIWDVDGPAQQKSLTCTNDRTSKILKDIAGVSLDENNTITVAVSGPVVTSVHKYDTIIATLRADVELDIEINLMKDEENKASLQYLMSEVLSDQQWIALLQASGNTPDNPTESLPMGTVVERSISTVAGIFSEPKNTEQSTNSQSNTKG
ncbi:MAG: hypothetical protein CMF46_04665 [Legionellales bacterium]|nr:hypothetical protein [Legionellales bacterium]